MKEFFKRHKVAIAVLLSFVVGFAAGFLLCPPISRFPIFRSLVSRLPVSPPSKCLAPEYALVTKVIDGDTVIVEGGYHIRLLGIDTDEKNYPCWEPAKKELERLVLNKRVCLVKDKTDVDIYGRCLRYVFVDGENVNLQLVKEGLAVARFYPPDIKYEREIQEAEKEAMKNKIGCKWHNLK